MRAAARGAALGIVALMTLSGCSSGGGDDTTAFCESMRSASARTGAIVDLDLDDERAVETAIADLETVRADAPDEIRDEAAAVADVYATVLRSLAAAAPQSRNDVLAELQSQLDAVDASAVALQDYAADTCGLRFDDPQAPTPTPTPLDIED